jgi:hypothetical protein
MTKRQSHHRGEFLLAAAVIFGTMVMAPCRANADIFETNNAGSCSGGGSAGGGLCFQSSPGVYVPYTLSGLLSGAYGPLTIGSGTTEYVVTDDILGGSFSFTYNLTAFTNGTTRPVAANNATCQVNGMTTADFARSSVACTIVDVAGTNTGTINSSGAFTTGQQINNALSPMTITFNATNGYGKTFDLGFVSMQNTGTVTVPDGGSTGVYLLLSLFTVSGVVWLKRKATS